ncbi:hypothetical protein J6590_104613 [Homalodisca vitripennis]|nr:hypothetical protein J6590_104613 [Homalodisca vitripennis]
MHQVVEYGDAVVTALLRHRMNGDEPLCCLEQSVRYHLVRQWQQKAVRIRQSLNDSRIFPHSPDKSDPIQQYVDLVGALNEDATSDSCRAVCADR